jgi:exosortase/archaeosortase family protein
MKNRYIQEVLKSPKYSGFRSFLLKTFVFLALFIVISYIVGQKTVGSSMLYGFNMYIYGGMGYVLLFSIVGFVLLYREKLFNIEKSKYKIRDLALLISGFVLVALFYIVELNVKKIDINWINIIWIHALFLCSLFSVVLGVYGIDFIKGFYKEFKKELLYFLIFGIVTYSLMHQVWKLWPYLSAIVTKVVYSMLKLISSDVKLILPNTLIFKSFGAKIAEACSGVYSIFIFTGLYLFILFVDWNKLNKKKAFIIFIPAIVGAFAVNILRVFALMIIGAYLSPEAAAGLYHSYTGMIFFLIYFIVFWGIAYRWLKK